MRNIFNEKGELIVPLRAKVRIPEGPVRQKDSSVVVSEAYCPHGHSLMSDVEVEGEKGIHFIYTDESGNKKTDIVISPVVRKCRKKSFRVSRLKKMKS